MTSLEEKVTGDGGVGGRWQNGNVDPQDILRARDQSRNRLQLCDAMTLRTAEVVAGGYSVSWSENATH